MHSIKHTVKSLLSKILNLQGMEFTNMIGKKEINF